MHYQETLDPTNKTIKKPYARLPSMIRALTDQFSLEPQLDPNEIFRKIPICVRNDPLWMSASIRSYLKVQINQRTRYMKKNSPNQIKIKFTHDVIKFKEIHQLILPPDHMPKLICSETHLAEVAKSYEARGFLRGRKSEEERVPHRYLIVLQYDQDISLNCRYQELVSKQKKEYICTREHSGFFFNCATLEFFVVRMTSTDRHVGVPMVHLHVVPMIPNLLE
jgi:hypothetical protein